MNKNDVAGLIAEFREHTSYEHEASYGNIFERGADALTTLSARVETLEARWAMIDQLRADEGHSVEILFDNHDFVGPPCVIRVTSDYGENYKSHFGDTIDECLHKAVEALAGE